MNNPRPDTRFLSDSASITTDDSQWLTNLTASSTGGYETASARCALAGDGAGRSIEMSVDITDLNAGTMIDHGADLGTSVYRIVIDGGEVDFLHAGTSIATLFPPNISGTAAEYIFAWSTEPNPATTGAANALRSEIMIYDVTNDEMTWTAVTHTSVAANASAAFAVGGYYNGSTLVSVFDGTINSVRVSARFHSRIETREHFVAQTTAPTIAGITACEAPLEPAAVCEAGALAGSQYQAAAASLTSGRNRHRLLGPVVQLQVPSAPVFGADLSTTVPATWVYTDAAGFQVPLSLIWRRRIPRHADWLLGFVQWATWYTAGSTVDVSLRIACADKPPALATEFNFVDLTRTTHDSVGGIGTRELWDDLRVRRDDAGWSWLWAGIRVDVTAPTVNAVVLRTLALAPYAKASAGAQPPFEFGA